MLFPEGTSDDGNRILPFFSALFSVAERRLADGRPLTVQPVSIAYAELNGFPLGRSLRPLLAWYGDMELAPPSLAFRRAGPGQGRGRVPPAGHHRPVRLAQGAGRSLPPGHRPGRGRGHRRSATMIGRMIGHNDPGQMTSIGSRRSGRRVTANGRILPMAMPRPSCCRRTGACQPRPTDSACRRPSSSRPTAAR